MVDFRQSLINSTSDKVLKRLLSAASHVAMELTTPVFFENWFGLIF